MYKIKHIPCYTHLNKTVAIFYLECPFSGSHAASIVQGPNGLQPNIKIENSGNYYSNCYTPPAPDHSVLMGSGTYSMLIIIFTIQWIIVCNWWWTIWWTGPLALPRSLPSPPEHRSKRRRLSSEEDPLDVGREKGNEVTYYGQSPASLSSQASWHSEVDHGEHN